MDNKSKTVLFLTRNPNSSFYDIFHSFFDSPTEVSIELKELEDILLELKSTGEVVTQLEGKVILYSKVKVEDKDVVAEPITDEAFERELQIIVDDTNDRIAALINRVRTERLGEYAGSQEVDSLVNYNRHQGWKRSADQLAQIGGWVYDRLNGKTAADRGSVSTKIRKALGYSS
jgi:hypothetical protein